MSIKKAFEGWQSEEARRLAPKRAGLADFITANCDDEEEAGAAHEFLTAMFERGKQAKSKGGK